jgi:tetratricopeptide (TPR) repeat protein
MTPLLLLTAFVWLAYGATCRSGFVIDDIEGIEHYDGKLKKFDYGHFSKWLIFKVFKKNKTLHHLLSIILHNLCVVSLYAFLCTFTSHTVAFIASALFAVHPITNQGVAWVSGRGYSIGLLTALSSINLYAYTTHLHAQHVIYLPILIGCAALYYIAVNAQFTFLMTPIVLCVLGYYPLAIVFFLVSLYLGKGIIKEVIGIRAKTFKEQNLGHITSLKFKKIFVAFKTLAYYTLLIIFPKRLGLYHPFHYHYSDKTEKIDLMCLLGMFIVALCGVLFFVGSLPIKLAVVWYLFYVVIFLNWITIQQFIAERYVHIASIGLFILAAYILQYSSIALTFVFALYLMRTWVHLTSYDNEISYYQSNIWNFNNSEVAFANLGVCYLKANLMGSAMDMWAIAVKINPNYDVAYYNMSSLMKQGGNLNDAYKYLKKVVESPGCHFKEIWSKEIKQLEHEIEYTNKVGELRKKIVILGNNPERKKEAEGLMRQLDEVNNLHNRFEQEEKNKIAYLNTERQKVQYQIEELDKSAVVVNTPIPMEKIVEMRDKNFSIIEEAVNKLIIENPQA